MRHATSLRIKLEQYRWITNTTDGKGESMTLLENWRNLAYGEGTDNKAKEVLWKKYFQIEKGIYEQILSNPKDVLSCTVKELAQKFDTDIQTITGFLDGINDSLVKPNPIEDMEESTVIQLDIDLEKLYYNMVEAKAEWLYNLKEWDALLDVDRRKELYRQQKQSGTIVKGEKVGRNDPCPCGSGKKYKHCHGKN